MINFLTLVLDGQPWISHHITILNKLKCDWQWHVVEGVAEPVNDTAWCKRMPARLSRDGTHEYLVELAKYHPRVFHYPAISWPGKTAMLNHATERMTKPGLLWQLDSDEIWMTHQIENVAMMFEQNPKRDAAYFKCDYWLGQSIKTISRNTYGDNSYEWLRTFRFRPGMKWICHEPPVLETKDIRVFTKEQTEAMGLVFQHYAYALESQVALKEIYYGYKDAVQQWRQLQSETVFPCLVKNYLKWVTDDTVCEKVQT
jgi:hypothetical protein